MTTIGVVGGGVLGKAIARGFMEHAEVRVFDVIEERSTCRTLAEVATCDFVFICLPTPALPDGRCDTLAIDDFLRTAKHDGHWTCESCYVIRSTVPVGYTQRQAELRSLDLPLLHSPEFLTARCSLTDFQCPARNIVGVPSLGFDLPAMNWWKSAEERLTRLYVERFPGVPVLDMHSNASELVKLACNSFFAAKVTLFNLFYDAAKAAGVSWEDVRNGILSDGRIAHAHTAVPGPSGELGFGGACLPKDVLNLHMSCCELDVDSAILSAVLERNEKTREHMTL